MVTIRPIEAGDRAAWQPLFKGYLDFYETSISPDVYETSFTRLLSDDPNDFHGAVAVEDGKLIGIVHFLFHRHMWKTEHVCYLQDLFADPAVRGKGVGSKLIEYVYAEADKAGCPTVYWLTQDFNQQARYLYDRIGQLTPFIRYNRA